MEHNFQKSKKFDSSQNLAIFWGSEGLVEIAQIIHQE